MKALPCQTPNCSGAPRSNGIIQLPNGEPYVVGVPTLPLTAKCARCRRPSRFTARQFFALPELSVARLRELKVLEPLTRDWVGSGLTVDQAEQTIGAGFMGPTSIAPPHSKAVADAPGVLTGRKCPTSGVWRAPDGGTIPLSKGEKFPPRRKKAVLWTLVSTA